MTRQFRAEVTSRIQGVHIREGIPFSMSRTSRRSYRPILDPFVETVNPGKTSHPKDIAMGYDYQLLHIVRHICAALIAPRLQAEK